MRLVRPASRRGGPRLAALVRPVFELFFRRSQICLGHNQFVRLDTLQALGGFPTSGATEDSTLGYALGAPRRPDRGAADGGADRPAGDHREGGPAERALVPGRARRRRRSSGASGGREPTAFNLAQLVRHVGNKVVEWPIAALVYPVTGFLGWYLAYQVRATTRVWFYLGHRRAHRSRWGSRSGWAASSPRT